MRFFSGQADRLGVCNVLGMIMLILAAAAAIIVIVDAAHRSGPADDQIAQLVRVFAFDRLSLVPSGRPLRSTDMPKSAVEWRYDPKLAGIPPDSADLLIGQ